MGQGQSISSGHLAGDKPRTLSMGKTPQQRRKDIKVQRIGALSNQEEKSRVAVYQRVSKVWLRGSGGGNEIQGEGIVLKTDAVYGEQGLKKVPNGWKGRGEIFVKIS